ncbi:MAG: phage holin family protein [Chitinophagaceae bacterium]|nr:phage holin family protein [Chitinophagaceae bacterium]
MERTFAKVEELVTAIKEYAEVRIDEVKLTTAEKTSRLLANVLAAAIVAIVLIFFVIFASVAVALLLGLWTGKLWIGFLIVACLYLLVGIIAWFARGKFIRLPLMNGMISQLFKMEEDEED